MHYCAWKNIHMVLNNKCINARKGLCCQTDSSVMMYCQCRSAVKTASRLIWHLKNMVKDSTDDIPMPCKPVAYWFPSQHILVIPWDGLISLQTHYPTQVSHCTSRRRSFSCFSYNILLLFRSTREDSTSHWSTFQQNSRQRWEEKLLNQ